MSMQNRKNNKTLQTKQSFKCVTNFGLMVLQNSSHKLLQNLQPQELQNKKNLPFRSINSINVQQKSSKKSVNLMIYQIYTKCYDDLYHPSSHTAPQTQKRQGAISLRSRSRQLLPFRVPQDHYNLKKLTHSLHQLDSHVKEIKVKNTSLATSILFSHGNQETRKFLHRTKQVFGDKVCKLKRKKIMASVAVTSCNFKEKNAHKQSHKANINEELYFQTLRPDFTVRTKKQPLQLREERRKTLGIQEADLKNYDNSRRGLTAEAKRKEKIKKPKDFRQLNMKGFAAKICLTLESRQKVSTKTLIKLMNLNVKCFGDGTLRKRCL